MHIKINSIASSYYTIQSNKSKYIFYLIQFDLTFQTRNVHDYIADLDSEIHLYLRSNRLLEQLNEWNPTPAALGSSEPLCACIEEVWIMLYESGYIEIGDIHLVQSWLNSLLSVGYKFPKVLSGEGEVVVEKEITPLPTVVNVETKSNSTETKSLKEN